MSFLWTSLGALAVAVIFYAYRDGTVARTRRERSRRERVTYMLWVMANPDLLKSLP
jgi:hypothetical protein